METLSPRSLLLDVPFYPNIGRSTYAPYGAYCQQVCFKMILGAMLPGVERNLTLPDLEAITGKSEGGTFPTHYLMWFADSGFEVKQRASFDWLAFRDKGINYYRELFGEQHAAFNARSDLAHEQRVVDDFLSVVPVVAERPTVADIRQLLREGWYLRAGVDAGILDAQKDGYFGHSVVPIGYDGDDIIFHDPGFPPQEARHENAELFQAAMDSFGGILDQVRLNDDRIRFFD